MEIVKYLIEQGADIHAQDDYALRMSANNGRLEVIKYLIEYLVENGADINALRMSASHGYLEVVKCLVEHGSDIHTNNVAFKYSAVEGHLDVVKYLIIDCNMLINKKTLDYLKVSCLSEIVNIINARDLHQQLENNLNKPIINDKIKIK